MLLCCGAALQRTSGGRQIKREDSPTKSDGSPNSSISNTNLIEATSGRGRTEPFFAFFLQKPTPAKDLIAKLCSVIKITGNAMCVKSQAGGVRGIQCNRTSPTQSQSTISRISKYQNGM